MNRIIRKNEIINLSSDSVFTILDDISVVLYVFGGFNIQFNLGSNSNVKVFHFNVDNSSSVKINLNGENAEVLYYYSIINKKDNVIDFDIYHNALNTVSNIYNHAVNVFDKRFLLNVNGRVLKNISGCVCNQSNEIINMRNGHSIICPNLLIDCYDVNSDHSAYVGKFDDDKLFYLRSRGISYKMALQMLLHSFLVNVSVDNEIISDFLCELEKI